MFEVFLVEKSVWRFWEGVIDTSFGGVWCAGLTKKQFNMVGYFGRTCILAQDFE